MPRLMTKPDRFRVLAFVVVADVQRQLVRVGQQRDGGSVDLLEVVLVGVLGAAQVEFLAHPPVLDRAGRLRAAPVGGLAVDCGRQPAGGLVGPLLGADAQPDGERARGLGDG